ncbi:hypothetical protein SAMN03159428_04950 [Kosakonia radicincitans]|uniref:Uncharacterized protein n=2 Tax=Kosakonia radicincitans TaxID=283686 RepID=A0AAX2EZL7_9ENTR|nr:hypothetical protein SAMN03159468_04977 [Kosakonia radicincitans]SFR26329.1 hypothetical protein SAMN03159514_04937 [Kosakonia radicincitans]SFU16862.1 hypothetical protein SAMN03159428_04950 [Kosakonia radicincitans]SFY32393.1 hypothetical protein SAMN03159436_04927 [Kosakonia radicincitans]
MKVLNTHMVSEPTPSELLTSLLLLCQTLQSAADHIRRPHPRATVAEPDETLDPFAQRIQRACLYAARVDRLLAMETSLADTGRQLEAKGLLSVAAGDDYARAALSWLQQISGTHDGERA